MYDVGDSERFYLRVWDEAGALAAPATLQVVRTKPDGTSATFTLAGLTITAEAVGVYYVELTLDQAGVWTFVWTATGPAQVETVRVVVASSNASGPCTDWIGAADVFAVAPCSTIAEADRDYGTAAEAAEAATRILYLLSGRRYPGVCLSTVRPCCPCGSTRSLRTCGCSTAHEITLGAYPILAISEVLIDGVAFTDYRVDDYRWLRRLDGDDWPCCQDLDLAATEPETFSVSYVWGREAPIDAILAARRLACELYQGYLGGACKLPSRIRTAVRQGVEIGFLDPMEFLNEGKTGIYEVDLFLMGERYGRANLGTVTASPDRLPSVRRTSTS